MTNDEIKKLIVSYSTGTSEDNLNELFEQVTSIPDDPNEDSWAKNILDSFELIKKHIGDNKALELLIDAYDLYQRNYPNAFKHKSDILRNTCYMQIANNDMETAHKTMNRYLYNALEQMKFRLDIPKMHYFSFRGISEYSIKEVEKEQLNLAHPRAFNDPLDTILVWWLDNEIRTSKNNNQELNFRLLMKKASEHIKLRCLVGSKYQNKDTWNERKVEDLSVLMWAHYAKSHTGMCIEFDFDKDFFKKGKPNEEKELIMVAPIEYTKKIDTNKEVPSIKKALFTKSFFWNYENEMRLCYFNINENDEFPTIECKGAIKAIYLGVKCSDSDRRRVEKAIGDKDIPLYKMEVDEKKLTQFKKVQIG